MFRQSKISQKPIFQMFLENLSKPQDSEKKLFCLIINFFSEKGSLGKLEWTLESKTLDNGMPSVWLT